MASKSAQHEPEKAEVIEELLDQVDQTLDRVKVLYEQFFLGIQKQPPTHLHADVERKLRDLQQMQIRNTALRYRFATVQQKFGSYNNYWRRTLRQIENGTYHRNLAKIGRQAALTGEDIPDEILAAMPKRMREQVKRDREAALALKRRREHTDADFLDEVDTGAVAATTRKTTDGAHILEDDDNFDLDAYFRSVTNEEQTSPEARAYEAEPAMEPPPRTPSFASPMRIPRAQTFEGEQATDADLVPPPSSSQRPAPITSSPPHANPAVRAAVGMRVATPPVGVPVAPRMTPTAMPAQRPSQPIPTQRPPSQPMPAQRPSQPIPTQRPNQPAPPTATSTIPMPTMPTMPTQAIPTQRAASPTSGALPPVPPLGRPAVPPSQVSRPLPVMPGASTTRGPVAVETLSGPFAREQTGSPSQPSGPSPSGGHPRAPSGGHPAPSGAYPRAPSGEHPAPSGAYPAHPDAPAEPHPAARSGQQPAVRSGPHPAARTAPGLGPQRPAGQRPVSGGASATPAGRPQPIQATTPTRATTQPGVSAPGRQGPPPGMTDADVNALYAKYVKAKEAIGEKAGPGSYGKLLQTINAQAPKIMEQYRAKGVDFQVVVKDNQVVIRAKPKP